MQYIKNAELTRLHGVSDKAVRNWIEASLNGKIDLELIEIEGKKYIADSLHNDVLIERLVQKGKKYRNKRAQKTITPTQEFYDLYSHSQVIEIANSLDKHREVPSHYRYFGKGAIYWNAHLHKFYQASKTNMLTATVELLKLEKGYFDSILSNHEFVNLVDLGVGNGLAARDLLAYLKTTGKLKKYIGIDASKDLLKITERNISEWFDGDIVTEMHVRDVSHEQFGETISDTYDTDASSTLNIVLFLGGTIGNFREPSISLRAIRESLGKDDILITSDEFDNENARKFFGSANLETFTNVSLRNQLLLELLGLDDSMYEMEHIFEEKIKSHLVQARLKTEVLINIRSLNYQKQIFLRKGERILVFRMWEWTNNELIELYEKNGLSQLRMTKLPNNEYVLLVSQVNTSLNHPIAR
jgi:uncharacterized SAM-dependent methyltransferase